MALVQYLPALMREPEPVCSVCIANYNGLEIIGDCIDSVLAQQGGMSVEIIVHDDASTDGSAEWIRQRYPQVELLLSQANAGFCVANNRMVAHARGRYVLLLNNDAALFPGALSALVDAAGARERPAILTLPQYDWETASLVDRGCLLDFFYNPVPNLDADRQEVAYGIGACLFLTRELWIGLGGFPEWFGSMAEDMYLCCLARLRGVPTVAVLASGYRHRQGASFGGNRVEAGKLNTTYRRRYFSERNKTFVMVICTPTWMVWPLLALHLAVLAVEGGLLTLFKRDARVWKQIYGRALAGVVRELGTLAAQRRDAQEHRQARQGTYFRVFTAMPRKFVLLRRHGLPDMR